MNIKIAIRVENLMFPNHYFFTAFCIKQEYFKQCNYLNSMFMSYVVT